MADATKDETRYVVSAAACVVVDEDKARHTLYYGAPVPAFVKGDQAERLVDGGFIVAAGQPVKVTPADGSDPVELVPSPGAMPTVLSDGGTVEPGKAPASGAKPGPRSGR